MTRKLLAMETPSLNIKHKSILNVFALPNYTSQRTSRQRIRTGASENESTPPDQSESKLQHVVKVRQCVMCKVYHNTQKLFSFLSPFFFFFLLSIPFLFTFSRINVTKRKSLAQSPVTRKVHHVVFHFQCVSFSRHLIKLGQTKRLFLSNWICLFAFL